VGTHRAGRAEVRVGNLRPGAAILAAGAAHNHHRARPNRAAEAAHNHHRARPNHPAAEAANSRH